MFIYILVIKKYMDYKWFIFGKNVLNLNCSIIYSLNKYEKVVKYGFKF